MEYWRHRAARIETWLEAERATLPVWAVVMGGFGIALWFWLPGPAAWQGAMLVGLAIGAAGVAFSGGRLGRAMMLGGILLAVGVGGMWLRATLVEAPRLHGLWVGQIRGRVEQVEVIGARRQLRAVVAVTGAGLDRGMRVRLSVDLDHVPAGFDEGAVVAMKARIAPPPPMTLPGSHDFARDFYFAGIGGSGRALGPIVVVAPGRAAGLNPLRRAIKQAIERHLPTDQAAIAEALAVGDHANLPFADAEAMRRSGMAHLLAVSGLHVAAAVAAAMLLCLRLLALSRRLALRFNLVLVSGGAGALAGIGYTMLTGMQVPTVRSCIAALLVLGAIAIGREALSLRLIAVGAAAVLLVHPEALVGPSFQLSFAAVTSIVALFAIPAVHDFGAHRDEPWWRRRLRQLALLALSGLVVELALMPLALYQFHKAGLYGVGANLLAIPLTTMVIMPAEALALLIEPTGLAGPVWRIVGWSIAALLGIAHHVGQADGAVTMVPTMPRLALLLMIGGGLWMALWRQRQRWWGLTAILAGAAMTAATPVPALLVTGDGRQMALVGDDGIPRSLRNGRNGAASSFAHQLLAEGSAFDGDVLPMDQMTGADCNARLCRATLDRSGRRLVVLATRGSGFAPTDEVVGACRTADIVVADSNLPATCRPRWLLLDRIQLLESGGVHITLGDQPRIDTVAARLGHHPWVD